MENKDTTNLTISVKGYSVSPEGETYIHDVTHEDICACMVVGLTDEGDKMNVKCQFIGLWGTMRLYWVLDAIRRSVGDQKYTEAAARVAFERLMASKDKD